MRDTSFVKALLKLLVVAAVLASGCALSPERRSLLLREGSADLDEINRSLADPLPGLRCDAALACARTGDSTCMGTVVYLLDEPDESVRTCGLNAMALRCDEASRAHLAEALANPELAVRAIHASETCASGDAVLIIANHASFHEHVSDPSKLLAPLVIPTSIDERLAWMRSAHAVGTPSGKVESEIEELEAELERRRVEAECRSAQAAALVATAEQRRAEGNFYGARRAIEEAARLGADVSKARRNLAHSEGLKALADARTSLDAGNLPDADAHLSVAEERGVDATDLRADLAAARISAANDLLRQAIKLAAQGQFREADEMSAEAAQLGADLASYEIAVGRAERARGCATIELTSSARDGIKTCRTELDLQQVWEENGDGTVTLRGELVDAALSARMSGWVFAITATSAAEALKSEYDSSSERMRERLVNRLNHDRAVKALGAKFRSLLDRTIVCAKIWNPTYQDRHYAISDQVGDIFRGDIEAGSYHAFSVGRSTNGVITYAATRRLRCSGRACSVQFRDMPETVMDALERGKFTTQVCVGGPFTMKKKHYYIMGTHEFYALIPSKVFFRFLSNDELIWEAK